jgi:predicted CXXCH cytochrome family protein
VSPHTGDALSLTSDTCATCHAAHTAPGENLADQAAPVSNLCFECHDGTGSSLDVKAEFSAAGVEPNDPTTDSWYSHPATALDDHTSDSVNEFGGKLDRHSSCADCHQPHRADGTAPTQTTGGWGVSGAIVGASGVVVTNTSGAAPTYSFSATGGTFEYQLCLKCHSGFTQLPSNAGKPPSQWTLDKGVELDPLNAKSYHPIEAAGTNATTAMTNSLSGTSPYKLWDFSVGDTIRCTNCHSGPTTPAAGTAADTTLPVHASLNRGILLAPYLDRTLKAKGEAYAASDFALCYLCHAEAPFATSTGTTATNFVGVPGAPFGSTLQSLHALHLTGIGNLSTGTAGGIDTAGAGQGNATCAECHFRLHSTDQAYDAGDRSNTRLVNFAPDVQAYGGTLSWTSTGTGQGGCTLTCHGYVHDAVTYDSAGTP